ncbi:hypothetical protein H4582DRAFT_1904833 [Lactarius indigo]|nr:hypothetical protein H4582DRAFT_1904833 [Lactarius indigo]
MPSRRPMCLLLMTTMKLRISQESKRRRSRCRLIPLMTVVMTVTMIPVRKLCCQSLIQRSPDVTRAKRCLLRMMTTVTKNLRTSLARIRVKMKNLMLTRTRTPIPTLQWTPVPILTRIPIPTKRKSPQRQIDRHPKLKQNLQVQTLAPALILIRTWPKDLQRRPDRSPRQCNPLRAQILAPARIRIQKTTHRIAPAQKTRRRRRSGQLPHPFLGAHRALRQALLSPRTNLMKRLLRRSRPIPAWCK